jgi:hypothetical protein
MLSKAIQHTIPRHNRHQAAEFGGWKPMSSWQRNVVGGMRNEVQHKWHLFIKTGV